MRRLMLGGAALAIGIASTVAVATEDPIATRKQLMQSNGASMGAAQALVKGEVPFDARVAMAALQNFEAVGYAFGDYFPPGSDQGDTRASPKIWAEMAEFQQYVTDFREDAAAAVAAKPETLEAFQTALGPIGENCQQCHEEFREEN
ncbi:MAG: cytochrome c [Pseudomonadota bacterium]|nr:cytochrome c [Pseudomonadota bacterium]